MKESQATSDMKHNGEAMRALDLHVPSCSIRIHLLSMGRISAVCVTEEHSIRSKQQTKSIFIPLRLEAIANRLGASWSRPGKAGTRCSLEVSIGDKKAKSYELLLDARCKDMTIFLLVYFSFTQT